MDTLYMQWYNDIINRDNEYNAIEFITLKSGEYREEFPNGVYGIFQYRNGKRNGEYKYYNANDVLFEEGMYKDGELDGTTTTYYEDGEIKYSADYKNGLLDGNYITYYYRGNIFNDQEVDATVLKQIIHYTNGIDEPNYRAELIYPEDDKRFKAVRYYVDYNLDREIVYYKDRYSTDKTMNKEGYIETHYYDDDFERKESVIERDDNDKVNGKVITYYDNDNNDVKEEYIVINGRGQGRYVKRYPITGNINIEYTMVNGLKQGLYKEYYMNRNIKEEAEYKDDMIVGRHIKYDVDGNIVQ